MNQALGYARTSTVDQNPELQVDELAAAGCHRIFVERAGGAETDRPQLAGALDRLAGTAGWLLVAAELLRLAQAVERAHIARGELARARELHRRSEAMVGHDWPRGRQEVAVATPPKEVPPPRRQGSDRGDFGR